MNEATLREFEGVDAAIMSGDLLWTDLEPVMDYISRWQRVIHEFIDQQNRNAE